MTAHFLQECKKELINGYTKKRHPFRYFSLATHTEKSLGLRTVVLRKLKDDFTLVFYTDLRSEKIAHIKLNPKVSALFYHPKKLLQVKISGKAFLEENETIKNELWNTIQQNSKKDYTTNLAPGTPIKNPDLVGYKERNHFGVVNIISDKIEVLQLKRPNHLRILYAKNNEWNGEFLTP